MSDIRPFAMPKWGIEMSEGLLASWGVAEGAAFTRGTILAVIETDKISNDVEAEFDGVLARHVAQPGETYSVGALLGVITVGDAASDAVERFVAGYGRSGGDTTAGANVQAAPAPAATPADVARTEPEAEREAASDGVEASPAARARARAAGLRLESIAGSGARGRITFQDVDQAARPVPAPTASGSVCIDATGSALDGVYASPLAKRLAVRHGVDLSDVAGAGPRGRIRKADVLTRISKNAVAPVEDAGPGAQGGPPSPTEGVEITRMSPMRKAIARQLTLSKTTIPHFYLRVKVRTDALAALRASARRASGEAPSVNDYLVRAAALALMRCPDVNVQVHGDEVHRFPRADIAVAVATDKGLLTPIVHAADTKSVAAISREIRGLAERARAGKLQPEAYQGGSFSISNLGMFGVDAFDAIINPPQAAILAVGATSREMMETADGFRFGATINLSLSCDHRAIDGATGARFLSALKALIEAPESLTA